MSVTELSQRLALSTGDVVKTLFMKGIMVQVNQVRPAVHKGSLLSLMQDWTFEHAQAQGSEPPLA